MNILIIGGAGFIGTNLAIQLKKEFYNVVVYDDYSKTNKENIIKLKENGIKIINSDITEIHSFYGVMGNIDIVYDLASPQMNDCNKNPEKCYTTNIKGLYILLILLKKLGVKKIIFSSTSALYTLKQGICDEYAEIGGENDYTISKNIGELMIHHICEKDKIDYCIFRNSPVYGPWQYTGDGGAGITLRLIDSALFQNKVTIYMQGMQRLEQIFVQDLVNYYVMALKKGNGIYNVSTKQNYSVREIIEVVEQETGKKCICHYEDGEAYYRSFDNTRLIKDFGKINFTTFNKGITQTISWYKSIKGE